MYMNIRVASCHNEHDATLIYKIRIVRTFIRLRLPVFANVSDKALYDVYAEDTGLSVFHIPLYAFPDNYPPLLFLFA